jgi:hypothetical protein
MRQHTLTYLEIELYAPNLAIIPDLDCNSLYILNNSLHCILSSFVVEGNITTAKPFRPCLFALMLLSFWNSWLMAS